MRERDAIKFELPNGKTVAIWCQRPVFPVVGEQRTASGLKTAWGEEPYRRLEPRREQVGPNSYTIRGWESYIEQGVVRTRDDLTTEYELFVDEWRFTITEDLREVKDLPVTVRITGRREG